MTAIDAGIGELHQYDSRVIRFGDFRTDDLDTTIQPVPASIIHHIFRTFETLTPVHPVGIGRTNLTLIRPTIVQTDAATPYVGFDRRESLTRRPAVSVHLEPAAYGSLSPATYHVTFFVEAAGSAAFEVSGYAAGGIVHGAGPRTASGKVGIAVTLEDLPASGGYVTIEQTDGESWTWFSTRLSYPPLVFTPVPSL